MMEESVYGIWTSMYGWFTPAIFFLLLNLVIGTIAVTSMGQKEQQKLARSSSVTERLRFLNRFRQRSEETPSIAATTVPLLEEEEKATVVEEGEGLSQDQVYADIKEHDLSRIRSDTLPDAGSVRPEKLPKNLKKSASAKSAFNHFEAENVPRPSSVRVNKTRHFGDDELDEPGSEEVDAKADDFINRFKQNLKLQRLDSIIRYKEMVNRGN